MADITDAVVIADVPVLRIIQLLVDGCSGELAAGGAKAKAFEAVSIRATGDRAFVIKGWAGGCLGPAVRLRVPWGELGDSTVAYQDKAAGEWQPAETLDVGLSAESGRMALFVRFRLPVGDVYTARFWNVC
ncbi:hypothetical protein JW859_05195 [bacterium]|nr:hypothetical protein [bacterium]